MKRALLIASLVIVADQALKIWVKLSFLMNDCFGVIEAVILHHGGSIDKFVGDAAMALFGAPSAIERAPRRALEAALEVRQRLAEFNRERRLASPIGIHVGINSGEVIAGNVGGAARRDFTVLGDTVNVCARLCKQLPVNRITIGEKTYELVKGNRQFKLKDLGDTMIRGRERSMRSYEVLV